MKTICRFTIKLEGFQNDSVELFITNNTKIIALELIKHVLIFLIFFGFVFLIQSASASTIPYPTPEDLYKQSYVVLYGQVIAKEPEQGSDSYYQIKVEQYFKNPQKSDFITAVTNQGTSDENVTYPQFKVGDKVIFYIVNKETTLVISPYSTKAGEACDIHAFLGPAPISGEPIARGQPSQLTLLDENGLRIGAVQINHQILLRYDLTNNYPASRNFTVEVSVQNENDTSVTLHKKQTTELGACEYEDGGLKWSFVPPKSGYYDVSVTENGEFRAGADFQVGNSTAKTMVSPLQQFKSGIIAQDVKCKDGLTLIIKLENNSPACVKPINVQKLISWGWAKPLLS